MGWQMQAPPRRVPLAPRTLMCALLCRRAEGEKLSRKNGELEAATRRVRAQLRDAEAERCGCLGLESTVGGRRPLCCAP